MVTLVIGTAAFMRYRSILSTAERKKKRRHHAIAARELVRAGSLLNARAPRGSISHAVAMWHKRRARNG